MKKEAKKLKANINALKAYMKSEEYLKASPNEQNLCHRQLSSMNAYYNILLIRIAKQEEVDLFVMACFEHQEVDCSICLT